MPRKGEKVVLSPEEKARKREIGLRNIQRAHEVQRQNRQLRAEKLAQFVALNPFSNMKEICEGIGIPSTGFSKQMIRNALAQPLMIDKIKAYKEEFISPTVSADIGERYRTLALQAVEKAQERLDSKTCKDNTLVEILRVCSQYLAPKNAQVQINAGAGSLVGILSDLQSSAQESLSKLNNTEKLIGPE